MAKTANKTVRRIRDVMREGRRAFAEGVMLEACPYESGEADRSLWILTWRAARDEALAAADPLKSLPDPLDDLYFLEGEKKT